MVTKVRSLKALNHNKFAESNEFISCCHDLTGKFLLWFYNCFYKLSVLTFRTKLITNSVYEGFDKKNQNQLDRKIAIVGEWIE